LQHDLEAAVVSVIHHAGRDPDPALRALAFQAVEVASAAGVNWLSQITVVHGLPGDLGVPTILVEWE
jgi:hypothetical protein